jgi:apolipoprotein N-acyltransferase
MRQSARLGKPEFMVLPSLDPETPGGVCQSLHGAYTAFAAASIGLPIIRSEITSHAQIFDAHGRILAESQGIPDDVVIASILPGKRWTFQTYAGDWFLGVCVILFVGIARRSALQP